MAVEHVTAEHEDRPFAVLDVGSNSARMIVFRLRDGEHLDVIEDARAPLRLARELHAGAELGPEAIDRTLEALRDFRAVAEGAGADRILAVATSAVRDALDGRLLLDRARELGVPLQIIDGDTEARLGFVGAVHDLSVTSGATLDVGGGSAEISRFHDRRLTQTWSFELGSLRVSDRYLDDDPPTGSQLKKLRRSVAEIARRRRHRDAEERRAPDRHRRDGPQPGEDRHAPDRASAPTAARVRASPPIGWRSSCTISRARR